MQGEEVSNDWDPPAAATFWINRAARLVAKMQDGRLRPLGFSMSQMPVLAELGDGAALPQRDLARAARVEQPTMANLLERMERDGLVERAPDPADGRSSLVSLTRRARRAFPEGKAALIAGDRDATRGFSAEEKAQLIALLRRVVDNLT